MSLKVDLTKCVSMNGLFHDFSIGDLYNKNTERIVKEKPLWNDDEINNRSHVKVAWNNQPQSNLKYSSHNTANTRLKNLEVDKSLQLSIALGLVQENNFTKYINASKEIEENIANVDINCKWLTSNEYLTETAIQNANCDRVQEEDFTHVVVAIQHGRKFILSLKYLTNSDNTTTKIEESIIAYLKDEQVLHTDQGIELRHDQIDEFLKVTDYSGLDLHLNHLVDVRSILVNMKNILHSIDERPLCVWLMPKQCLLESICSDDNKTDNKKSLFKSEILLRSSEISICVQVLDQMSSFIRSLNDLITESSCMNYINASLIKLKEVAKTLSEQIKNIIKNYRLNSCLPEIEFVQILKYLQQVTRSDSFMMLWLKSKQKEVNILKKVIHTENIITVENEFVDDLHEDDCVKVILKHKLMDESLIEGINELTKNIKSSSISQNKLSVNKEQMMMTDSFSSLSFVDMFRELAILNQSNNRVTFYLEIEKAEETKATIEYYQGGSKIPFANLPPKLNSLMVDSLSDWSTINVQWTFFSYNEEKLEPEYYSDDSAERGKFHVGSDQIKDEGSKKDEVTGMANRNPTENVCTSQSVVEFSQSLYYEVTCLLLAEGSDFKEKKIIYHSNKFPQTCSFESIPAEGEFLIKVQPKVKMEMDLVGMPYYKNHWIVRDKQPTDAIYHLEADVSEASLIMTNVDVYRKEEHHVKDHLRINGFFSNIQLGSLYDRRKDTVIKGLSLWDEETLSQPGFVNERKTPSHDWKFCLDHSISKKMDSFNIEGGLKLSLICGLLNLEGSAEYLTDSTDNNNTASVSLIYNETTITRELTQKTFKNIDNVDLLESDQFTHVVVAIQYGGKCTMRFEKELTGVENKTTVGQSLKAAITGVPVDVEFKNSNSSSNDETKKDIICKVKSDIPLDEVADDVDAAMKLYKSLPNKLNSNNIGVPVWVWLMPKHRLPYHATIAGNIVQEISNDLIHHTISVIEEFYVFIARCHILIELSRYFPTIQDTIKTFMNYLERFNVKFQKEVLRELIVDIRGGVKHQDDLREFLIDLRQSPFDRLKVSNWLDMIKEEIDLLEIYRKSMENENNNIKMQLNNEYENSFITTDVCVVLNIQVVQKHYSYLEDLQSYLEDGITSSNTDGKTNYWYKDEMFMQKMRQKIIQFIDFAKANKDQKHCKFIARSVSLTATKSKPNVYVDIFRKGSMEIEDFDLNSVYAELRVRNRSDVDITVQIKNSQSYVGSIFEISYEKKNKEMSTTESESVDLVKVHQKKIYSVQYCQVKEGYIFSANDLQQQTEYVFTTRKRILDLGLYGCVVNKTVRTYSFKQPMNIQIKTLQHNQVQLSWSIPSGVKVDLYEICCVELENNISEFYRLSKVTFNSTTLHWLNFNTLYNITVRACNEEEEISDWTDECVVRTNPLLLPEIKSIKFVDNSLQIKLQEKIPEKLYNLGMKFILQHKYLLVDSSWEVSLLEYKEESLLLTSSKLFNENGWYAIQFRLSTKFGSSRWSSEMKIRSNNETEKKSIKDIFDDNAADQNCITNMDMKLAIHKMQITKDIGHLSKYPDNKINALIERLQRITVGDTDCLSEALCWMKNRKLHIAPHSPHDILIAFFTYLDILQKQIVKKQFWKNQIAIPLVSKYYQEDENPSDILLENMNDVNKPLVSFVRFGDLAISKSQLINLMLRKHHAINKKDVFWRRRDDNIPHRKFVGFMELFSSFDCAFDENDAEVVNLRGDALKNQQMFKAMAIQSDLLVMMISSQASLKTDLKYIMDDLHEELKRLKKKIKVLLLYDIPTNPVDLELIFKEFEMAFPIVNYLQLKNKSVVDRIHAMVYSGLMQEKCDRKLSRNQNLKLPTFLQNLRYDSEIIHSNAKKIVECVKEVSEVRKSFWYRLLPLHLSNDGNNPHRFLKALSKQEITEKEIKGSEQVASVLEKYFLEPLTSMKTSEEFLQFLHAFHQYLSWLINAEGEDLKLEIDAMDLISECVRLYEAYTTLNNGPIVKPLKIFVERFTEMLFAGLKINIFDDEAHNLHLNWINAILNTSKNVIKEKLKLESDPNILLVSSINFDDDLDSVIVDAMFGAGTPILPIWKDKYLGLRLVLLSIVGCPYHAVLVFEAIASKSSKDRNYKNDIKKITSFCIGISDVTILNVSEKSYGEASICINSVTNLLPDIRNREVEPKVIVCWNRRLMDKKEEFTKCLENLKQSDIETEALLIGASTENVTDNITFVSAPDKKNFEPDSLAQFSEELLILKSSVLIKNKEFAMTNMDFAIEKIAETWMKVYKSPRSCISCCKI